MQAKESKMGKVRQSIVKKKNIQLLAAIIILLSVALPACICVQNYFILSKSVKKGWRIFSCAKLLRTFR